MAVSPIHWIRGGSATPRMVKCAGCINEALKYPPPPSSEYAIDGTHTHTLVEATIKQALNGGVWNAGVYLGKELSDHEGEFEVDLDRCKRANVAVGYVQRRISEVHRQFGIRPKVELEKFVDAGSRFGIHEWGGSADIVVYAMDSSDALIYVEVIDFKAGAIQVPPDSPQLICYTAGVLADFDYRMDLNIRRTIVQPIWGDQPKFIDSSLKEFIDVLHPVVEAVRETFDPEAPKASGPHCRYCRGAKPGRCETYNETVRNAMSVIDSDNLPTTIDGGQPLPFQLPDVADDTDNETIAMLLDAEPLVVAWFKDVRKIALSRANDGQKIPGQKLVRATTKRRWSKDAFERLSKMRIKKEVYTKTSLMTPKQVLESDAVKGMSDSQRDKVMALVEKPLGSLTLVPDSDPRQAAKFSLEDTFSDVPKLEQSETKPEPAKAPPPPPVL